MPVMKSSSWDIVEHMIKPVLERKIGASDISTSERQLSWTTIHYTTTVTKLSAVFVKTGGHLPRKSDTNICLAGIYQCIPESSFFTGNFAMTTWAKHAHGKGKYGSHSQEDVAAPNFFFDGAQQQSLFIGGRQQLLRGFSHICSKEIRPKKTDQEMSPDEVRDHGTFDFHDGFKEEMHKIIYIQCKCCITVSD